MENLRIPGPTPLPNEVLQAMTKQMINHRGAEFRKILLGVTENLKQLFQTKNDVFLLTGSGTGGLEALIVNTLSPGDKVLSVSIGVFGDRFASIAKQFGAEVISYKTEMGKAADVDAIKKALQAEPAIKAVLVTHNETSTGVTNDLKTIAATVKEFDKLLLVDAISSLGSIELPVDKWNCDVVASGSQKGWMAPPGLAMVSINEAGWKAFKKAKMPRFYWDFGKAKASLEKGENPWTPSITVVYAMSVSLEMMMKEGLPNIIERHKRIGNMTREGIKSLGLPLLADPEYASNTVTAVLGHEGLDLKKVSQLLKEKYQIVVSGGQGALTGKIFRIGHLGWVHENEIQDIISALKVILPEAGFRRA
ncbi:pyridoxal-phosphate-dependent aminotransferase family protein [Chloroflexota bacterium]